MNKWEIEELEAKLKKIEKAFNELVKDRDEWKKAFFEMKEIAEDGVHIMKNLLETQK